MSLEQVLHPTKKGDEQRQARCSSSTASPTKMFEEGDGFHSAADDSQMTAVTGVTGKQIRVIPALASSPTCVSDEDDGDDDDCVELEMEMDMSTVGSFAPTLASNSKKCDNNTFAESIQNRTVEIGLDAVSSVGSFAPTLTNNSIFQADDAEETVAHPVLLVAGAPSSPADAFNSDISTVGSIAPTLANNQRGGLTSESHHTATSIKQRIMEVWQDGMSSVGSYAPTLATFGTKPNHKTAATSRASTANRWSHSTGSTTAFSAVSSVGSEAPTLTTKRSTGRKSHSGDDTVLLHDDFFIDTIYNDDDSAAAVSSVGMSRTPTLASRRSVATNGPSVIFSNHDIPIAVHGIHRPVAATITAEPLAAGDVSTIGSRAPPTVLSGGALGTEPDVGSVKRSERRRLIPKQSSFSQNSTSRAIGSKPTHATSNNMHDNDTGLSFDHYASDMALLGGVLGRENLKSGLEDVVGTFLKRGAFAGLTIWVTLMITIIMVCPWSSYQFMTAPEQMANATLLVLLVGVNLNRLGPLLVNDRKCNWNFFTSGAMTASITVQFIAITSVSIMLFLPTPVLIDPIMGTRCHMVRWVEWTALAFVMCFLTESIDLPLEDANARHAWIVATMVALSALCGAVFPFCTTEASWWTVFAISCVLFSVVYFRLVWRAWRLYKMPPAVTTSEQEDYERAKYSFKLLAICSVIWTLLVVSWTACTLAIRHYGSDNNNNVNDPFANSLWTKEWIILAVENCCEGLSKIGYLSILLEVHELLFDDMSQTARRLEELRSYMSAVWDASTDVVVICSSHDHLVNAAVSPAFYQMEHAFGKHLTTPNARAAFRHNKHDQTTLVMEVDPYEGSYRTYEMDLSKPMTRGEANAMMKNSRNKARMVTPVFQKNLKVLSDLVCDACALAVPAGQKHYTVRRDFFSFDKKLRKQETLSCEAKVIKLKGKAFLIMLRDVSENVRTETRSVAAKDGSRNTVASSSRGGVGGANVRRRRAKHVEPTSSDLFLLPLGLNDGPYAETADEGDDNKNCLACTIM